MTDSLKNVPINKNGHFNPPLKSPEYLLNLQLAAQKLAQSCSLEGPGFSLIMMTDLETVKDPLSVIKALPSGSAVLFRDYFAYKRILIAKELCSISKQQKHPFIVAGDISLARQVRADGLHLPSHLIAKKGYWQDFNGFISAACHTIGEVRQACDNGVDFILLSPLFPTASHKGEPSLGPRQFSALAAASNVPVFALGGIGPQTLNRLSEISGKNIAGFAAISAFKGPTSPTR